MPPTAGYHNDIIQTWIQAIRCGIEAKEKQYLPEAEMCETFYGGDQKGIYSSEFTSDIGITNTTPGKTSGIDGNTPRRPMFNVRDNAAAKAVQIFTPMFLNGELQVSVDANKPFIPPPQLFGVIGDPNQPQPLPPENDPQALQNYVQQEMARQQYFAATQQAEIEYLDRTYRSSIIESTLNYLNKELNIKEEARPAIRDWIVRGMGFMHTEMMPMPNGTGNLPSAVYMDDDRIVIDPDARRLRDAKWVAIKCQHQPWEVARLYSAYGITERDLKPMSASYVGNRISETGGLGKENNVFTYWKVFSRCGIGARLKPINSRDPVFDQLDQALGDYCYLVISEGCPYPLNLTPYVEDMALKSGGLGAFQVVTSWPCPFYHDPDDPWPFTAGWFHDRKGSAWPKSHLSFAIGYLNFMAWILGFVAEKAYRDSRGVWIVDAEAADKLVQWMKNGQDEEILRITRGVDGGKVADMIEFINGPEFDGTLVTLYEFMKREYQDMTGITDLLQGQMDRQMRSAEEANVLQSAANLRPQDMADKVQAWLGRVMRKLAILARYSSTGQDLQPVIGTLGAMAWDSGIKTSNMADLFREATYSVETGKGRKPDVNTELDNINAAMQFVFPPMMQAYQMTGDPTSVNGVLQVWGEARNMKNIEKVMLKPFVPMMPEAEDKDKEDKEDKNEGSE